MPTQSKQVKLSFSQWLKLRRDIAELKQADIARICSESFNRLAKKGYRHSGATKKLG